MITLSTVKSTKIPAIGNECKKMISKTHPERFDTPDMLFARSMNVIAKNNIYEEYSKKIPKEASDFDIFRLTSDKIEDSYNRAIWVNPKTKQPYYLLKEDELENGDIVLRILNKNGKFLKNAQVTPQEGILLDLEDGRKLKTPILDCDITHTDFIDILASRYNPFAKFKTINIKKELAENIDNIMSGKEKIISMSYGAYVTLNDAAKSGNKIKKDIFNILEEHYPDTLKNIQNFKKYTKTKQILESAGNGGDKQYSAYLGYTGLQGVGGLNPIGKVDTNSASRNSLFTQHYERFNYPITTTPYGINISGLKGTDIELQHNLKSGIILHIKRGTSYSTPVRASKILLNNMMNDII